MQGLFFDHHKVLYNCEVQVRPMCPAVFGEYRRHLEGYAVFGWCLALGGEAVF